MRKTPGKYTICFQTDEETYWVAHGMAMKARTKLIDFYELMFKVGMSKLAADSKRKEKRLKKGDE